MIIFELLQPACKTRFYRDVTLLGAVRYQRKRSGGYSQPQTACPIAHGKPTDRLMHIEHRNKVRAGNLL